MYIVKLYVGLVGQGCKTDLAVGRIRSWRSYARRVRVGTRY
jgi:hypothetical protein